MACGRQLCRGRERSVLRESEELYGPGENSFWGARILCVGIRWSGKDNECYGDLETAGACGLD